MRQYKGIPRQHVPVAAPVLDPVDDTIRQAEPAWLLEKACCCPSRPAVRVIVPASDDRPRPAELLLCAHHYRSSVAGLISARAAVYDRAGVLISSAASSREGLVR